MIQKYFSTANKIIKSLLALLAIVFLVYQLFFQHDLNFHYSQLKLHLSEQTFAILLLVTIVLMPLNWLIEAIKWQYLISNSEKISLSTSVRAVLAGLSISSMSPNRIGEFFGRLFVLKQTPFWQGAFVSFIGSFAQSLTTFSLGFASFLFFFVSCPHCFEGLPLSEKWIYLAGIAYQLILLISFLIYFRIAWFIVLIPKKWRKIKRYSLILSRFGFLKLFIAFVLSSLRYLVFSFQFVLLLKGLGVPINYPILLLLVSCIFLLNTLSPTIALLELGVRASISLLVFSFYFANYTNQTFTYELEVVFASGLIWFINILFPSAVGLFFIQDLSFFKKTKDK